MSFFDEADEPPTAARRPSGRSRRPPPDRQAIQVRRAVAVTVLVVVIVLAAVGIHGCEVSQTNDALRSYATDVASLNQQSVGTGRTLFAALSGGGGASGATTLQNQVDGARASAQSQLGRALALSVPDQMQSAQRSFVLALRMRSDGLGDIAQNIQPALGTATPRDALQAIAGDMARFYASDVLYKDYSAPGIAAALHAAGIAVGGADGVEIDPGQFVPNLGWLAPSFIAARLHVTASPGATAAITPGLHGHAINSVSVGGTTLQTGSTNTLPASPPPTFSVSFTNTGTNPETNVVVKVSVGGTSVSGQTVVPQTTPGQTLSTQVQLSGAPPTGSFTLTATVEPVPGEKNTANNTLSFPVTFG